MSLVLSVLCFQCKKEEQIDFNNPDPAPIEQFFPIVYNAEFPAGNLPYPHHNPTYSQAQYDSLIEALFIINNFGLYQCGEQKEDCYFHSGLDFVLDNETPIFALEAGTVRANIGGNSFYRTLVIEDMDEPGFGWAYTHIYHFAVEPGDEVSKGQFLARVNFQGLDHIHLSRTKLKEGGSWTNFNDLIDIYPDDYFTFIDESNPIIKTPFHFFENGTDSLFTSGDTIATVSGEVDIVVSMRDPGQYGGEYNVSSGYWGNRLAVRNINYRILKNGEEILSRSSFDFRNLGFVFHAERWRETLTVFKHHTVLESEDGNPGTFLSHYILTNASDDAEGMIDPQDEALSWNTLELNTAGEALYPNGLYHIEVTAYDSNGNESVVVDEVWVEN
jgi:hypothetical protein